MSSVYTKNNRAVSIFYTELEYINSGTFGSVYKISLSNKIFALKKARENREYVHRELAILQKISHKNITNLHYFWREEKELPVLNLIIDFCQFTLFDLLIQKNFIYKNYKKYFFQLLTALDYLHTKNICHRDLKPQNILISGNLLKICDFGSAKILCNGKSITYITSRNYRAPENLIDANRSYTCNIDIWAAGVIFFEIHMMKRNNQFAYAFPGGISTEVLHNIIINLDVKSDELRRMGVYSAMISVCDRLRRNKNILQTVSGDLYFILEGALRFVNSERLSAEQLLQMRYFNK